MGKKHFTEEQIAFALRQAESGTSVAEVIRKLGISEQTFYRWKRESGGLRTDQAKRLKRLLADAELDKAILREAASGRPFAVAANF